MNEVFAVLADAAGARHYEATRIQTGVRALARDVLARRGRLLVYADAQTFALIIATAAEYRTVQALETSERRLAPVILLGGLESGTAEDRWFRPRETSGEPGGRDPFDRGGESRAGGDELSSLERFGLIERPGPVFDANVSAAFERYAPVAIFVIGPAGRLGAVIEQSRSYGRRTQVQLFRTGEVQGAEDWTSLGNEDTREDQRGRDWIVTLDGRPIEGEDAEVAAMADRDAKLAVALETVISRRMTRG